MRIYMHPGVSFLVRRQLSRKESTARQTCTDRPAPLLSNEAKFLTGSDGDGAGELVASFVAHVSQLVALLDEDYAAHVLSLTNWSAICDFSCVRFFCASSVRSCARLV